MVIGEAGILIYGGTTWTMTNTTTSDRINQEIIDFGAKYRRVLIEVNIVNAALDPEWVTLSAYDIGTKRWYE